MSVSVSRMKMMKKLFLEKKVIEDDKQKEKDKIR